jgi:hypothetical protein
MKEEYSNKARHLAMELSMSDVITQRAVPAVRASDAERDQVVARLQRHFADGRLTQAELEERAGAALAAQTRDQLGALTADLPDEDERPARPAMALDRCLLCVLLCVHPCAALIYRLLCRRRTAGI